MHIFLIPCPFSLEFENVPFALDGGYFACPSLRHVANYSCKKISPTTYLLAGYICYRQMDDNYANSLTVMYVRLETLLNLVF